MATRRGKHLVSKTSEPAAGKVFDTATKQFVMERIESSADGGRVYAEQLFSQATKRIQALATQVESSNQSNARMLAGVSERAESLRVRQEQTETKLDGTIAHAVAFEDRLNTEMAELRRRLTVPSQEKVIVPGTSQVEVQFDREAAQHVVETILQTKPEPSAAGNAQAWWECVEDLDVLLTAYRERTGLNIKTLIFSRSRDGVLSVVPTFGI